MAHALVFDSGVGGLTIAAALAEAAPGWRIDYAADAGFFPYGLKSDEELKARLPGLLATLAAEAQPDLVVIACNTASTLAIDAIRARLAIPVVGTVPTIKPAAALTRTGVIGVLATPGTVRRAYLDDLERQFAVGVTVIRHGSAGLVDLAERAVRGERPSQTQIDAEVAPMFATPDGARIDVVALACTHFPLLRDEIARACPAGVTLIDTGEAVARQALKVAGSLPTLSRSGEGSLTQPPSDSSPERGRLGGGAPPAIAWVTGGVANRASIAPALATFGYLDVRVLDI